MTTTVILSSLLFSSHSFGTASQHTAVGFPSFSLTRSIMTRGNQREVNRKRAEKRKENAPKSKKPDANKRMQRDAEIMRQKQKEAEERKKQMAEAKK
jgi:hypothetical protein